MEANKKIRNANLKNLFIEFDSKVKELIDDIGDTNLHKIFHDIESQIVRSKVLNGERRIDGRDTRTVRNISIESGFLPRVHGSALFTRGETQAIVATTLGTSRDEQMIDSVEGEYSDSFMLHYNFPPFQLVKLVGLELQKEEKLVMVDLQKELLYQFYHQKMILLTQLE